jgi:hypothetical protein
MHVWTGGEEKKVYAKQFSFMQTANDDDIQKSLYLHSLFFDY